MWQCSATNNEHHDEPLRNKQLPLREPYLSSKHVSLSNNNNNCIIILKKTEWLLNQNDRWWRAIEEPIVKIYFDSVEYILHILQRPGQRSLCLLTAAVNNIHTILTLTYMYWEEDVPTWASVPVSFSEWGCRVCDGGGGGLLMVNRMLALNYLLEMIRAMGDIHPLGFPWTYSWCEASLPSPHRSDFADCSGFAGNFHLPRRLIPCDVDFSGLHGRLPSAHHFVPFEIISVPFAHTHCVVAMDTTPERLVHEFVYER